MLRLPLRHHSVALLQQGRNFTATATVTVFDQDGFMLSGALVEGSWTLSATSIGSGSGTTDGSGVTSIDSSKEKPSSGEVFEFTVTNLVLGGYTYDAASNVLNSGSATVP